MKKPDFFVIGAPKCGTTAMHNYFRQHPDVYVSTRKDYAHHFDTDLDSPIQVRDPKRYLRLFAAAAHETRIGEVCAWYLYSKTAAEEIHRFDPSARIIAMVRNPVDALYSLHSQLLYNGNEDITDFEAALRAEPARKAGHRIPPTAVAKWCLSYRDTVRFSEQLQRYFDAFGRNHVHVVVFDDFAADTRRAFGEVCRFLGVSGDVDIDFHVVNPNKVLRSLRLTKLLRRLPRFILDVGKAIVPQWLYLKYESRPPMDPELRKRLQAESAPEVEKLSELLGRDLTHWSRHAE